MTLRWLPKALRDRDAQIDYIAERSPRAAIDQGDRIAHQIDTLRDHPKMGRPGRVAGTRELVITGTPFIVIYRYRPRAQRIELIRLLHGAQRDPPLQQ